MGNDIPTRSRELVRARDQDRCQRCGSTNAPAWHHRRRRAVKGGHFQHCACIGIQLCPTCHGWAHSQPKAAALVGFIVSSHEEAPWTIPVRTFDGWVRNTCDGDWEESEDPSLIVDN